mmetsp:Transcript_52396/g.147008  ORF Transcript_52396/g.147008 Transcript_52396/m.147008 type:complete len:313 (+) Transcript_52396:105-1043(+)
MGCGASAGREATPEENKFIYAGMAKEMMTLCRAAALEKGSTVKIAAPPEIETMRTGATQLRDAASGGAAGDAADGEEGAAAAPSGGVAGMLKAGLAKATSVASQGASAVLGTVADGLDAAVCKIEQPFTEVGAGVIADKKQVISDVLAHYIHEVSVEEPEALCAAGPSGISEKLITAAVPAIAEQLQPKVDEGVQQQMGLKAWNSAIETYNGAIEAAKAVVDVSNILKSIELDIRQYTCEQTVLAIGKLMAEQEAAIRSDPNEKAHLSPWVFTKVFGGVNAGVLTHADYLIVKKDLEVAQKEWDKLQKQQNN